MAVLSNHADAQQADLTLILFQQGNALCWSTQTALVKAQKRGGNGVI